MKAALLVSPEQIEIREVDPPPLGDGEVRIRTALAGICGTDISIFQGRRAAPYPFILGHEVMGRVAAAGAGVGKLRVGDRVIVEPNYPCGECPLCRRGRGAVCAHKGSMGVNLPGCFSEFATAPAEFVWRIPDGVSDRDAVTIEPLTVSLHGLLRSGAGKGDTVAVIGCGVVGLLLIHSAAAEGIRVIAHDRIPHKREMALGMGAAIASGGEDAAALWEREGVTAVFECAGAAATVELALAAAPRGSVAVLLGLSSAPASFSPMRLVREGVQVLTSMIYDHPGDFRHAIERVASGVLNPARVVTQTFPFASLGDALRLAASGHEGKILVGME